MKNITAVFTESRAYRIAEPLDEGGQAELFLIQGEPKVAKLYTSLTAEELRIQEQRLRYMIRSGPPSPAFVWPLELIRQPSLGYVMDWIQGYTKLGLLNYTGNLCRVGLRMRLRICFRLVEAFEKLHQSAGYAYCDLSGDNILCKAQTGEVKIIDNDNLWVDGVMPPSTVAGTYRCMAPEIEAQTVNHPNVETDLHSLAVLIFMTLLFHHPLLGDRVHDDALLEEDALGKGALYIYHPSEARNRYTKYSEYGGISISILPPSMRKLFEETFIAGLHHPHRRVRETNWKRELINQLDTLINCPNQNCIGRQTFLPPLPTTSTTCVWCRTPIADINLMKILDPLTNRLIRYKVISEGIQLTAHHCKLNQMFRFRNEDACAVIKMDPEHGLTLQNISGETFSYYQPNDPTPRPFPPGKRVKLQPGYRIVFGANGLIGEMMSP